MISITSRSTKGSVVVMQVVSVHDFGVSVADSGKILEAYGIHREQTGKDA